MYQLAYIGMLKRNLLWLSIYSFGILLFILEGAAAVYIAARRRVILGGESLELSEEGIVVVDMSYRKKADIHWREVKRVKESRHYYFLILEGRRFLPIPRQDMTEAQESLLKKHARRVRWQKLRIVDCSILDIRNSMRHLCRRKVHGESQWKAGLEDSGGKDGQKGKA
ncbi:MAG: YcxB family protein [[Clostridium] scindens]